MDLVLQDTQSILTVSNTIFNFDFNQALIHQVIIAYKAGTRRGTRAQKTRSEVTGSNKKPWRQKGTGRARSGSTKSPIWRSGGVTFAARPQDHSQKVNKKMYRGALKGIFSELIRHNILIVFKEFSIQEPKTKILVNKLKDIALESVLIITSEIDKFLFLAARNLHKVDICSVYSINPVRLISFDKVIITADAIRKIEDILLL